MQPPVTEAAEIRRSCTVVIVIVISEFL